MEDIYDRKEIALKEIKNNEKEIHQLIHQKLARIRFECFDVASQYKIMDGRSVVKDNDK